MKSRYADHQYARRFNRLREAAGDTTALMDRILGILDMDDLGDREVVEIGCGTGVVSRELHRRGAAVKGFDLSDAMVRCARGIPSADGETGPVYGIADHRSIPLPSASADLVFGAWTINIMLAEMETGLRNAALDALVTESRRLLKPRGMIAFLVPAESAGTDGCGALESRHRFRSEVLENRWCFPSRQTSRRILTFFLGKPAWRRYRKGWPQPFLQRAVLLWCRIGE